MVFVLKNVYDDVELKAIKWFDNRRASVLSTYESVNPVVNTSRIYRKAKELVHVPYSSIFSTYNNLAVQICLTVFSVYIKSTLDKKKWYYKLFFHFLDFTVAQSWLMYCSSITVMKKKLRINNDSCKLSNESWQINMTKEGEAIIVWCWEAIQAKKRHDPAALVPTKAIWLDDLDHWPVFIGNGKKVRCKDPGCKATARIKWSKYSVNFCLLTKSNCFHFFHNE